MSNLKQKVAKGLLWSIIESWGRQIFSSVIFFLLARLLGPESYGLVALSSVYVAFIQIFIDQGFTQAIIQRSSLEPEHLDSAFWTSVATAMVLVLGSLFGADLIAILFKEPRIASIIRCLSFTLLLSALSGVQYAVLQRNLVFKGIATRSLVSVVGGGIVGVGMAVTGFGVWSLVGQQLFAALLRSLILWSVGEWRPRLRFSVRHFRELFKFSISILGLNILGFINQRSDDLLIGYFLGPVALGYYSIAYKVLLILLDVLSGMTVRVAMPTFSKLQGNPDHLRGAFYKATQFTSLIVFPVCFSIAVLSPDLIKTMFGSQWLPSAPVLQILSFIGITRSIFAFNGVVIVALGKPNWRLMITSIHTVVNVIAFYAVVHWGITAVASAYVLRAYLLSPLDLWAVKEIISIQLKSYFMQHAAPVLSALAMTGVMFFTQVYLTPGWDSFGRVLLALCLGCLTYVSMIRLISPALFKQTTDTFRLVLPSKA
jgi:O-antigen/teichoic acid export membrane protein